MKWTMYKVDSMFYKAFGTLEGFPSHFNMEQFVQKAQTIQILTQFYIKTSFINVFVFCFWHLLEFSHIVRDITLQCYSEAFKCFASCRLNLGRLIMWEMTIWWDELRLMKHLHDYSWLWKVRRIENISISINSIFHSSIWNLLLKL